MKRFLIIALIASLLIASCHASAEEDVILPLPELMEALRDAGREAEIILAYDVNINGDTPETAVFLVQARDAAQLTVLDTGEDGAWQITGRNDTIPSSVITSASLLLTDGFGFRTGRDHVSLTLQKYVPVEGEPALLQAYRCLEFDRTPEGSWALCSVFDIPFEDAEEGRCPNRILDCTEDGWVYRLYEEFTDSDGRWWIDRSAMIMEKTVPEEEMAPFTKLSSLDYHSLMEYLRSLAPTEYEHAPSYSDPATVLPTTAPTSVPDDPTGKGQDTVYYNPVGGRYYHVDSECPSVAPAYRPLTPIPVDELNSERFSILQPCPHCVISGSPSSGSHRRTRRREKTHEKAS